MTKPRSAADWISYLLIAGGLAAIVFMAYAVWVSYTPLFWVDQWAFLQELIGNHSHYSAALVWQQHNEHRIPLPKLFYLVDLYLFHGTNTFLLVLIFCLQLLHVAWLAMVYARIGQLSAAAWRTAVGFTAMCLFAFSQYENFLFGFELAMVLPALGATVAISSLGLFYLSLQDSRQAKRRFLLLSWAAAAVATLSLSNGLFVWPILLVLMLIWRLPRRVVIATAVLGGSLIGLWFIGYSNHAISARSFSAVPQLIRYLLLLYGSSWSDVSERFGMGLAAVAVPGAAAAGVWILVKRQKDVFAAVLLSLTGFIMASSFATVLGRIGMGLEQARSSRYQTAALLFWCSLSVLIIRAASNARRHQAWLLSIQAVFVCLFVAAAALAGPFLLNTRIHAEQMTRAAVAMKAGVNDGPRVLYPIVRPWTGQDFLLFGDYLRSRRWSIFAHDEAYPLGREFKRYYRIGSPEACRGDIDPVVAIPDYRRPGFRVSGWAWDFTAHAPGKAVALTDSAGRLIGMAPSGFSRPDVPQAIPSINRNDTGFVGYIPGDLEAPATNVFVILADNVSACPLSGSPLKLDLASIRYSGPEPTGATLNLVRNNFRPRGAIETFGGQPYPIADGSQPVTVHAGEAMTGWIVDPAGRSGSAADVAVDGVPLAMQYGFNRPDIANRLKSPEAHRCGFLATMPPLAPGEHTIALRVVSRDRDLYFEGLPVKVAAKDEDPRLMPTADSVTPNSGSGARQRFVAVYSDPASYGDLDGTQLLINSDQNNAGACSVYANAFGLYLFNDAGTVLVGPAKPGGRLSNSQCALERNSSVSASGNSRTVTFSLTFQHSFSGAKTLYLYASGKKSNSGWQKRGVWNVP